jgi:ABC-type transport system involved in Fe-S cluster assembly fused permease/ATPase subunit
MDKGRIVENGTYEDLMQMAGSFEWIKVGLWKTVHMRI